jgi:hypothetical protein
MKRLMKRSSRAAAHLTSQIYLYSAEGKAKPVKGKSNTALSCGKKSNMAEKCGEKSNTASNC